MYVCVQMYVDICIYETISVHVFLLTFSYHIEV